MKKTKKMMLGVIATLMAGTVAGCSDNKQQSQDCDDWEWDPETEDFVCDDDDTAGGSRGSSYIKKPGKSQIGKEFNSKAKSGIGSGTKGGFFGG